MAYDNFTDDLKAQLNIVDIIGREVQMKKASESLSAVCEHADTKDITMLNLTDRNKVEDIRSMSSDINIKVVDVADEFDEKNLLDMGQAVFAIGSDTSVSTLLKLSKLCAEYDAKMLGCIYAAEL